MTYKRCTGIFNLTKSRFLSFKCSSARRIVLLCIKEEDLAAAWEELGDMQRGCDFDPCARTIKICHGTDFCKHGQRNSVALGLKLDALYQARELPWKLKMAVSGCLNDCAEACIRDIALLGTTKGWRLQVGGNGGGVPEPGLPEHIPSEEEVPVIVDRLIAWFVARNRCCRLGRIVDEVGRDKVRRVAALGEGVERS